MPRPQQPPQYQEHASGQAYCRIDGKRRYLGVFGSPESHQRFAELYQEWTASQSVSRPTSTVTCRTLGEAYRDSCSHQAADQRDRIKRAFEFVADLFGDDPASRFDVVRLRQVRRRMIDADLARSYINAMIGCVKRGFRWARSEGLIPKGIIEDLEALPGLRYGQGGRETSARGAADPEHVNLILTELHDILADMLRLQMLTGMRPSEVAAVRPVDLTEHVEGTWLYTPATHKNAHRGQSRFVVIGPRGQQVLAKYLDRDSEAFCFDPREVDHPQNRAAKDRYDVDTMRRAIERASKRLNRKRAENGLPPIPRVSLNQLRKLHGQRLREQFGIEAAQVQLGHAQQSTTERHYTAPSLPAAVEAQRAIG